MSFSSDVKAELKKKPFTFKNQHNRIADERGQEAARERIKESFISCGSVSDPNRSYHLEFVAEDEETASAIRKDLALFGITGGLVERKNHPVIYLKDSESISEILSIIGAHQSMMEFENVRIMKEVRGSVQRQVNCETANISKTVSAALRQITDIGYIRDTVGLEKLPPELQEIAKLRLSHPEAPLSELAEALKEPVSRSGINHRLRRCSQIADRLRKEKEQTEGPRGGQT